MMGTFCCPSSLKQDLFRFPHGVTAAFWFLFRADYFGGYIPIDRDSDGNMCPLSLPGGLALATGEGSV